MWWYILVPQHSRGRGRGITASARPFIVRTCLKGERKKEKKKKQTKQKDQKYKLKSLNPSTGCSSWKQELRGREGESLGPGLKRAVLAATPPEIGPQARVRK